MPPSPVVVVQLVVGITVAAGVAGTQLPGSFSADATAGQPQSADVPRRSHNRGGPALVQLTSGADAIFMLEKQGLGRSTPSIPLASLAEDEAGATAGHSGEKKGLIRSSLGTPEASMAEKKNGFESDSKPRMMTTETVATTTTAPKNKKEDSTVVLLVVILLLVIIVLLLVVVCCCCCTAAEVVEDLLSDHSDHHSDHSDSS